MPYIFHWEANCFHCVSQQNLDKTLWEKISVSLDVQLDVSWVGIEKIQRLNFVIGTQFWGVGEKSFDPDCANKLYIYCLELYLWANVFSSQHG